ncbi:MAG: hypothetical protein WC683_10215 [bacterium]|jgi:hypothetical protein
MAKGVKIGECVVERFRGKPVIVMPTEGRPFSFGVAKAQAVLAHRDMVQAFAEGRIDDIFGVDTIGEFKGHLILMVPLGNGFDFRFGQVKAALVVAHWVEIEEFVAQFGEEDEA